jgi:hypothetical protein
LSGVSVGLGLERKTDMPTSRRSLLNCEVFFHNAKILDVSSDKIVFAGEEAVNIKRLTVAISARNIELM